MTTTAHRLAHTLRALNVADAVLTVWLCALRGPDVAEWNPVLLPLLRSSVFLFAFVKLAGVAVLAEFLARRGQWLALAVLNVLYLGAVALSAALILNH